MSGFVNSYRLRKTHSISNSTSKLTKNRLADFFFAMDQSPGPFILRPVVTNQIANEDVGVNAEH